MTSPFVFNVAELLRSKNQMPVQRQQSGPSPTRIGPEMIAISEGEDVTVDATLTPIGSGIFVNAEVSTTLTGECVRCLRELRPDYTLRISQVFAAYDDFFTGDEALDDEDEVPMVEQDHIDLLQTVIDEAGLKLPFNPTCEGGCHNEDTGVPAPDGVSGEDEAEEKVDPRWSGLEKFL
ncbi:YceD family protein [Corynebacterium doosanense]|uniref:DNA-binding protein n=1 Tax=Corynebacterium doosanense CAU 212 = DSM 45436 TaxID=558173 RepID=A0A097IH24_9CORY|nr:YceD family protein [Corynebacterium doosanense]AIT61397.1 hypothetical protein CDOO_09080 [Corynebacterium doosanense CAU 212 = DSM 45436]